MPGTGGLWELLEETGLTGGGGGGGAPVPVPVNLGTWDIRPYCRLAGDQYRSIPDGTYTAGDLLDAAHAATAGRFGGYLILEPTTPGGVTVDLSYAGKSLGGGLTANGDFDINYDRSTSLTSGTSGGIILIGFKFVNGILQCNAPNVHLWYPEFTFPYTAWAAEPGYPTTNYHRENGGLYHGFGANNCRVYGMNCHDAGTGPTIQAGAHDITYQGWRVGVLDNGGDYTNVHPDSLQMLGGGNYNITLTDFDLHPTVRGFGPNIQNASNNSNTAHDTTNVTLARGWIRGAPGAGLQLNSFNGPSNPRIISGTMTDIDSWGNGPPGHTTDAGYQFIEGVQHTSSFDQITYDINSYPEPTRINFVTTRCRTGVDASAGGTVTDYYTAWTTTPGQRSTDALTFFDNLGYAMA